MKFHNQFERILNYWAKPFRAQVLMCTMTAVIVLDAFCLCAAQIPPIILPTKEFIVYASVEVINVEAINPESVRVNYRTKPATTVIPSVNFVAPGKNETKTNVSGDFSFTFNQTLLIEGSNTLGLTVNNSSYQHNVDITAIKTIIYSPKTDRNIVAKVLVEQGGVGVWLSVPVMHSISDYYHKITYDVPVANGSKTIWVGKSYVNIETYDLPDVPSEIFAWGETHLYRDDDGDHLSQTMNDVPSTIPPQSEYFRSKDSSDDVYFSQNNNLKSIGHIETLSFDDPGGPLPSTIIFRDVEAGVD